MTTLPDSLRALVERGPLAHLATLDPDGSPQVTVIWIGLDGNDVVSGHMHANRKVRNLQRDPRAVLSFDAPRTPGVFLAEHAVLRCTATVQEGGALDLLRRLGTVYVSPDFVFPAPEGDSAGYVVRYTVDRIGGVGSWARRDT